MENFLDFLISLVILAIIYFFIVGGSSRKQKTTTTNTTTKDIPLTDDAQKEKMNEEGMSNNIPLSVEVEDREIDSLNDVIDKVDEEQNTLKDVIDVVPPPADVNDVSAPSLAFTSKTKGVDYSGVQESIHPLMQDFDLRKAILYSEIVEKKYF